MDFALDDDQQMIVDTVRRFADRDLRAWAPDADRAGAPPDRLTAVGSDLGLFLDAVPSDAGGLLDGSYSHLTRALRAIELGRGCAALSALMECNVEPALAVGTWGSPAAKQALFGALGKGALAAMSYDSRGALTVTPEGEAIRISGKLPAAPALATASHVLIASGDVLALVATDGLRREAITPSGWRAARWATATLESVLVPREFVLARGDAGKTAIEQVLAWARVGLAARAVGVATAAMEYAEKYGKERVQFGQPIGRFEALVRLHDDSLTNITAARMVVLYAAWQIDRAQPGFADSASRARVLAGDAVARATIDAVQIFGGYGFVNDYPVEKLMRDARAFEALLGDERLGRVLSQKVA